MPQFKKGGPPARREEQYPEFVKQRELRHGEDAIRSWLSDRKAGTRKRSGGWDWSRVNKASHIPRGSKMGFEARQDALAPNPDQPHWSGSRFDRAKHVK